MDGLAYLGIAYALAWLAIGGYLTSIVRRQRTLEKKLEALKGQETNPD